MKHIRKSLPNVLLAIIVVLGIASISVWQFYLSIINVQGNIYRLWWAIFMGLLAYVAGFLVFSVFLRDNKEKMCM